ncbi:cinnamoyl-CoA reductase 1-like [Salvia miltiorrhiza]|uniref:Cinnamoyl-CoA reductase n=1 Tax=Salvia miltiorrhiza TaxID=226208 RepID=G9D7G9_SALMI|nr:cinnamoyl-CoA reductase 1-like [Salvia miltiorrhiza]XP_057794741.1 cinnamoyl-CoA reductase 1-like [Salvia miltiorrhiza]XP_057794742.1 cinnamoyl-CoA reductase 1-like [Salvia miltiorrhiza]XP_057794743.1 cinnamoyl-CoA reductase 1-like [Salvia miltiorrhiza]AEB69789.1 cinnamoyl-CoA reductase [Salvia miltiorrhiza]
MAEKDRIVCVTGAGGFVASWLIKLLLSQGYTVHGTLRNPGDEKYAHLRKLDNAAEKLKLFKADLLDFDSILAAVKGCVGVFHVACPVPQSSVPNPEVELVQPALDGTFNVLKACSEAKIGRVVVVSSVSAVFMIPDWPKDRVMDESCWSDKEYCRKTNNWYCYSKTVAEAEAFEYAKKSGLNVITVCPALVLGPMLQHTANASSLALIKLLKESYDEIENNLRKIVDVRDVAEALILVYEKPEAKGRYICMGHLIKNAELVDMLKILYPNYEFPRSIKEEGKDQVKMSSEKLQKLGWKYRPLKETIVDSVESYKGLGILWS